MYTSAPLRHSRPGAVARLQKQTPYSMFNTRGSVDEPLGSEKSSTHIRGRSHRYIDLDVHEDPWIILPHQGMTPPNRFTKVTKKVHFVMTAEPISTRFMYDASAFHLNDAPFNVALDRSFSFPIFSLENPEESPTSDRGYIPSQAA